MSGQDGHHLNHLNGSVCPYYYASILYLHNYSEVVLSFAVYLGRMGIIWEAQADARGRYFRLHKPPAHSGGKGAKYAKCAQLGQTVWAFKLLLGMGSRCFEP